VKKTAKKHKETVYIKPRTIKTVVYNASGPPSVSRDRIGRREDSETPTGTT
jgi:hypothetical protein